MFSFDVSWIGVVLATALSVGIGMFIYSPNVLGSIWARAYGWSADALKASPLQIGGAIVISFLISYFLAVLIKLLPVATIWEGAYTGFLVWLGFFVPSHFSGVLWAKRPLTAYLVDMTAKLLVLVASGFLLAFFK